jgi:hypothetical protein
LAAATAASVVSADLAFTIRETLARAGFVVAHAPKGAVSANTSTSIGTAILVYALRDAFDGFVSCFCADLFSRKSCFSPFGKGGLRPLFGCGGGILATTDLHQSWKDDEKKNPYDLCVVFHQRLLRSYARP